MFRIPLPFRDCYLLLTPPWPGLHPALQGGVLLLVCLTPLVLLLWLYRYELQLVPRLAARGLLGLRLAVLCLLLLLVCLQPIYARDRTRGEPGRVLVAVDRSGSMDVADPQREPVDKLRLARALGLAGDLCGDAQLDAWIRDYGEHKGPRWLGPGEARDDPARRGQLEQERRGVHDRVCERVDRLTRTEAARRVLSPEGVGLVQALAAKGHTVELLGFHGKLWDVKAEDLEGLFRKGEAGRDAGQPPDPAAAAADAAFTDLHLPLERALKGEGKVLGVVLLTDGQHNAGDPPNKMARELGEHRVPVYPVALGARKPPPDVAVIALKAPQAVFKDVDATLDVRFKVTGLEAQDLVVEVHRAGADKKLLEQRTVRHDGKDRDYTETFPVRMTEVGTQTLVATVRPADPQAKETCTDNNSRATTINVADDKARVLLVDGEARWEYHYLASALKRDRAIQLEAVVFEQPRLDEGLSPEELRKMGCPRQKLPEGPDALAGFDCIILGDVAVDRLPLAERQRLEKYVSDRGGTLVVLAGKRSMPLAYPEAEANGEADPLRKLLPIEDPRVAAPADGFPVTLTQAGRETKFMELDPEPGRSQERWAQMPPHYWAVVGQAKPGATPLACVPDPEAGAKPVGEREKEQALIVRHNYGFGRVLFVGLDSTWRWRYKVGDTYHHRFWGQAIRWAASDKPLVAGNDYVRFGTPQPVYRPDQEVEVVARLHESLGPLNPDLRAAARIVRVGGAKEGAVAEVALSRRPAQPRVLEGKVEKLPAGQYAVELAIPDLADKLRGPDPGKPLRAPFTVLPPDSTEMVDLETKWPLLEELAAKSGGQVFTPEDVSRLADLLRNQTVPHTEHHEQRLWQSWWLLLAVVLLLTGEWVGRKWAGLP
jgi:hypothetical protein